MRAYLSKLRKDYQKMSLTEEEALADPINQLESWIADAANNHVSEPNAFSLSTVDAEGKPHARIVLLRNLQADGLVFYSNYQSAKARQLDQNPHVSINFFWVDMERQVRIEGVAKKLSVVASNEYFQSRPRLNQIAAWASPQSEEVTSREALDDMVKAIEEKFKGVEVIEKPPFWGGYKVEPTYFEFWQGRPGRLHDRIAYRKNGSNWEKVRLAP